MGIGWYRGQGMSEKIWAKGLYWKAPNENQARFLIGKLGIHKDKFMEWLEAQPTSEKGYLLIDISERKGTPGEYNISLDTWRPTGQSKPAQPEGGDYDDPIPFGQHERGWVV
jgi:hypothetical protein